MQAREWYEQNLKQAEERGVLRGQVQGKIQGMARFCGKRLGRELSESEHAALASLVARVGEDQVEQAVLSFSAEALAAWLAEPQTT